MQAKPTIPTLNAIRSNHAPTAEAFDVLSQSIQNQPSFVDQESPTGAVDGTNNVFYVAKAPNPPSSLHLYVDTGSGGVLIPATLKGNKLVASIAPAKGAKVSASYRY